MYLVLTGAWVSLHIMHEVRGNLGNPGRQTKDKVQGNKFELPPLHFPQKTLFLALGCKNKGKKQSRIDLQTFLQQVVIVSPENPLVGRDPSSPLLISQDPSCPRQLSSEIPILKDLEKRSR